MGQEIGERKKYFSGSLTELKLIDIQDKKKFNIMGITYEILRKRESAEITLSIPKGKLKEAIEAREKLMSVRKML